MKKCNPKRWWFPTALAGALLIQYVAIFAVFEIRALADGDVFPLLGEPVMAFMIAWVGAISFPIGLCGVFIWSRRVLSHHFIVFIVAGWLLHLSIMVYGIIRPRKVLFLGLMILLILNIGGCWLPHAASSIPLWKGD